MSATWKASMAFLPKLAWLSVSALSFLAGPGTGAQAIRVEVEKDATYTREFDAIRDNVKASIEFHSMLIRVLDRDGKPRKFVVRMLFDPQTKLFFWEYFEVYSNYSSESAESDARVFASVSTVYISADRLTRFQITTAVPLAISESTDRYDSLNQAQDDLLNSFQREPLPDSRLEKSKAVDYLHSMPEGFLLQCKPDIKYPPRIETLKREGKSWKLQIRAQNGNTAEIWLDDAYNLELTNFTISPASRILGCRY
jgi:hypothetical protein